MKMKTVPLGIVLALLMLVASTATVLSYSPNTEGKNGANIYKIGQINGNGSIIAVIEFEGKRYLTSTNGGFIEIK